jgi:uncharacterized 2Fe-2S/4Fe-4S cluster protein (DUF4445 family)
MTNSPPSPAPGWIFPVSLSPPSLGNNTADTDRLVRALRQTLAAEQVTVDLPLIQRLPAILREADWKVHCVVLRNRTGAVLLDLFPAAAPRPVAGVALDLGTTRVVMRLVDLTSGTTLEETAFDNPQRAIGPDILARIHHADTEEGLAELGRLIVDSINGAIAGLCRNAGLTPDNVYALSLAGNTAMTHLFLGLSPQWIIREPYIPVVNTPPILEAGPLGIDMSPRGRVLVFPNIGSYFGGDLIAGILFSGIHHREETAFLVDVGTNAEVLLGNRHWLMACAGAAGPALEGGAARMGMPAGPGAIDRVRIDPESKQFDIHTIENKPARGICGSGLIDLAAQLFAAGMVDIRGKFVAETCGERLEEKDGIKHLVVVSAEERFTGKSLTLSQTDLDSLIRSKAAMYTILSTIVGTVGIPFGDIDTFYVAGTFGAFIDPESAIGIGMLPDLPRDRFVTLGNSSLEGAALALIDNNRLAEIDTVRDQITYMELNVNQEFMAKFSAAKFLPHTDQSLFPSVKTR